MGFDLNQIRSSLLRTPAAVSQMAAGQPADAVLFREAPDAWNIFEVLCHLAECEVSDWMPRVRVILSGERRFPPFDREAGVARYRGWSADRVANEFARLREASVQELDACHLTPQQLELTGIHPEFGEVPLRQLLATWATHDYGHIAQISRLLVRYHGQHVGPWAKYISLLRERPRSAAG